ncbi:MAG: protein kinase domain-containing protein [Actinomycetota bacterium]
MAVLADRYELARRLGSGGMAQVFAAYDRVLQRQVAIKLINDAHVRDPAGLERFTQEARLAAGLQHPNTVAVFDVGEHGGRPFIVMELVEGSTLADRLGHQGRLPLDETVAIADAVLAGLAAAHDRGMVHRDVKPSNILLPAGGGVKLADFGIATVGDSGDLTSAGQVLGTPRYLAPERAAGHAATPASDVYAVGAIMYECLAGGPVVHAGTAGGRTSAPPLADVVPQVPQDVAAVVDRALADNPLDRFANAQAMRHALGRSSAAAVPPGPAVPPEDATLVAPAAPAPDATQVMAVPRARRRLWPLVVGALGVLALVVVALNLPDGDTSGGPAASAQDPVQEPADEQPSPAEDADEETPEEVVDLNQLVGTLADDLDAAGEDGEDLLDELQELQSEPDPEEARELIEEVAESMAEGELDAELGEQAIAVLEQESRPETDDLVDASSLLAEVAATMPEWGDKGEDLQSELAELLEIEAPGNRAKEARDLVEEIEKWIDEGEIDAGRANDALAVLEPLTQPG